MFYVDGKSYEFKDGKFTTEDESIIAVLDNLADANLVDKEVPNKENSLEKPFEPEHIGGGYYQLSNGEKVKGKDAAVKAELELSNK